MRGSRQELVCAARGKRALLSLAFTARVAASPRCVWRVLSDPVSAEHWLPAFEGWSSAPPSGLATLAALRFRSRLRHVPVAAEMRVLEITPGRVRAHFRLGLLRFDARFSLGPEPGIAGGTRIGLMVSIANEIALVSGSLDRFAVRRLVSELAENTLGALSAHAEELALSGARSEPLQLEC